MDSKLENILAKHAEWVADNSKGRCADLRGADLSSADLSGANLWHSDLSGANLSGANLWHSDLRGANLRGACLSCANLLDADLGCADLSDAYLGCADLRGADLRGADLRGAILDFSSGIPLWCGSAYFKCDVKLIQQVLAHLCTLDCKDKQWVALRKVNSPFAKKSHRAHDLGLIKRKKC
jgi:uncharacterized protein YjbI with pentapeptide repeats